MKKNKVFLFVDGSNLYAGQYDLFGPKKYLDFSKFIEQVGKKVRIKFDQIYFYASYSPTPKRLTQKTKLYLKNEALFYKSVKQTKNTLFFKGYRSKTSGKEKEVDVKLAVDIVDFAHRNKYDSLCLCSGDADFMQALYAVSKLDKKISIICIENKIMFKSLLFYPMHIISFNKKPIKIHKIRKRPTIVKFNIKKVIKSV